MYKLKSMVQGSASRLLCLLIVCCGLQNSYGQSSTPFDGMAFQSYLVDSNGSAISGNKSLKFSIWDADTAGNLKWGETQTVTVNNGNFSVILGEGTWDSSAAGSRVSLADLFDGSERYIEITVDGTVLAPRLRMLPSPYTFKAKNADFASNSSNAATAQKISSTSGDETLVVSGSNANFKKNVIVTGDITGSNELVINKGSSGQSKLSGGTLNVLADNSNIASINVHGTPGNNQGTGLVYVGQSSNHGGGFVYNGDNTPALNYAGSDDITHFRRQDGTDYPVMSYKYNSSRVYFHAPIARRSHVSGFLEGSYSNVGESSRKSEPIYTLGSSYNPGEESLGNMYGLGYSHTNASFINKGGAHSWGMYVAADGDARVFLAASGPTADSYLLSNLGVGTSNPVSTLHVSETNGKYLSDYYPFSMTASGSTWRFGLDDEAGTGDDDLMFAYNGTAIGWMDPTSRKMNFYSDKRMKTNIKDFRDGILDDLTKISLYHYNWKTDPEGDQLVGFMAQDVQKYFPEFVDNEEGVLGLNMGNVAALSIPAIRELKQEKDDEISELKSANENLRKEIGNLKEDFENRISKLEKIIKSLSKD